MREINGDHKNHRWLLSQAKIWELLVSKHQNCHVLFTRVTIPPSLSTCKEIPKREIKLLGTRAVQQFLQHSWVGAAAFSLPFRRYSFMYEQCPAIKSPGSLIKNPTTFHKGGGRYSTYQRHGLLCGVLFNILVNEVIYRSKDQQCRKQSYREQICKPGGIWREKTNR